MSATIEAIDTICNAYGLSLNKSAAAGGRVGDLVAELEQEIFGQARSGNVKQRLMQMLDTLPEEDEEEPTEPASLQDLWNAQGGRQDTDSSTIGLQKAAADLAAGKPSFGGALLMLQRIS